MEKELRYSVLDTETLTFNDEARSIEGYAILFNSKSEILGGADGFVEVIENRALDGVDLSDVFLLYNHNYDEVLGSTKSGTMSTQVTSRGLWFRSTLPDTTRGRDTYTLIKRGDLSGMSFAFTVSDDKWNVRATPAERTIKSIGSVDEISIVPRPAYSETVVSARSIETKNKAVECINCADSSNKFAEEARKILKEIQND